MSLSVCSFLPFGSVIVNTRLFVCDVTLITAINKNEDQILHLAGGSASKVPFQQHDNTKNVSDKSANGGKIKEGRMKIGKLYCLHLGDKNDLP